MPFLALYFILLCCSCSVKILTVKSQKLQRISTVYLSYKKWIVDTVRSMIDSVKFIVIFWDHGHLTFWTITCMYVVEGLYDLKVFFYLSVLLGCFPIKIVIPIWSCILFMKRKDNLSIETWFRLYPVLYCLSWSRTCLNSAD